MRNFNHIIRFLTKVSLISFKFVDEFSIIWRKVFILNLRVMSLYCYFIFLPKYLWLQFWYCSSSFTYSASITLLFYIPELWWLSNKSWSDSYYFKAVLKKIFANIMLSFMHIYIHNESNFKIAIVLLNKVDNIKNSCIININNKKKFLQLDNCIDFLVEFVIHSFT